MDTDEQQSKPTNEIIKLVLHSKAAATTSTNPIQVEVQMPVHVEKISMYEAQTQTLSPSELSDLLSKEAGDEARLTGSNKYALLSLDEYQIIRTGEEHCLKKYFSDDDLSFSDEELTIDKQMKQMNFDDEQEDRTVLIENLNNNASITRHPSHSNLSNTFLFDETTPLSATLARSTSSRVSQSRYLQTFKEDDELDQLVASTFTPRSSNEKTLSSIRWFVHRAIDSCRENLTSLDQLLEHIPFSSERIHQRKVHRMHCILNIPNPVKGLQYYPSTSVQTD